MVGLGWLLSASHGALSCSLIRKSFVKSCSENALDDHRASPLLKTLLNRASRRSLAPPFPPHFPVLAPFPATAGRGRVLHVGGLGAERGGWSAGMSPRPFCPNRHRPRHPTPTDSVCLSKQSTPIWISPFLPPSLPPRVVVWQLNPFIFCLVVQPG